MFTSFFLILLVWGGYRRIRTIVGKRPFSPVKIGIRLFILGLAMGLLFLIHPLEKATILYGGIGGVAGALFVYVMCNGLHFTIEGDNLYYQINPYLSMFLVGLVFIRIVMKLPEILYLTAWLDASDKPPLDLSNTYRIMDPASFLIIMMLFVYFVGSSCWIYYRGSRITR